VKAAENSVVRSTSANFYPETAAMKAPEKWITEQRSINGLKALIEIH
jgi:hypothetical protein